MYTWLLDMIGNWLNMVARWIAMNKMATTFARLRFGKTPRVFIGMRWAVESQVWKRQRHKMAHCDKDQFDHIDLEVASGKHSLIEGHIFLGPLEFSVLEADLNTRFRATDHVSQIHVCRGDACCGHQPPVSDMKQEIWVVVPHIDRFGFIITSCPVSPKTVGTSQLCWAHHTLAIVIAMSRWPQP